MKRFKHIVYWIYFAIILSSIVAGLGYYLVEVKSFEMPVTISTISLSSCKGITYNGTYYVYKNNQLDKSNYITINGEEWVDNNDWYGTCKVKKGEITFYLGESGVPLVSGTISNGKMELSFSAYSTTVYYKEGSQPS